jgi:hypothetical protein
MIICDKLVQGSAEWIQTRLGVFTASQAAKLLTPTLKLSSQRKSLIATLAAERVLGEPVDDFGGTYWVDRGAALEQEAAAYFSLQTGLDYHAVGFVYRDESRDCGCSPDGLILDAGEPVAGLELKCPKASTHVQYLLDDKPQYQAQVQFSLWVTGLPRWYFMSYYPGLRPMLQTVEPDPAWQDAFSEHVPTVLSDLAEAVEIVRDDAIRKERRTA